VLVFVEFLDDAVDGFPVRFQPNDRLSLDGIVSGAERQPTHGTREEWRQGAHLILKSL